MNPSQSESFWKSQQQDQMQKWRTSTDHNPTNSHPSPRKCHPQQNRYYSLHFSTSLFPQLQTYQHMKSQKEQQFQWTSPKEQQLFALHQHYGNKWSSIAAKLGCRSDNCVKNKYYSTMRKGYRKLNRYITMIRRKRSAPHLFCNKLIKPEFLVKLNAVVDGTYVEKYEVKGKAVQCSREIERMLIDLARNETVYQGNQDKEFPLQEGLIGNIQEFNRGCKKRKGKRKQKGQEDEAQEESEEEEQIEPNVRVLDVEDKDIKAFSTSAATNIVQASKNQDQEEQKRSKNQEVLFPDNLMVDEQKQQKQGKGDNPLFKFDLDISRNSLDKSNLNYRLFIESTPTINTTRRFQEQAKYFQDSNYLKVSLSQMNSSYFKAKECPQPAGSFVQSIPQVKDKDKSLYDSVNIRREIEEEAEDYDKLQEYNRTRSSNLTYRKDNADLLQSRLALIMKQKEDNKQE